MPIDPAISAAASAMAQKRHASLTPERRAEIASKAAKAKWKGKTKAQRRAAVEPAAAARRKRKT
jgi:hypothetical protein